MKSKFLLAPVAIAAALCFGAVSAQSTTGAGAGAGTGSGTAAGTSSGSTATGGAAPRAQTGPATTTDRAAKQDTKQDSKLARGDRKFIEEAMGNGMFEVQAGQLAATKATDPQVKSFGEQLVKDHTSANQALQQIASKHQIEQPKELPRSMRNKLQDLQKKSGAEFDQQFVKDVGMKAHEDDVKKFQKASKDVKDPELKAWVDKTLPTLQQHHASAQKLPGAGGKDSARAGSGSSSDTSKSAAPGAGSGAGKSGTTAAGGNKGS